MKILIFGLPGSGKTTLAEPLAKLLGGVHINADEVRKKYEGHDMSKWDFSPEGRMRQADRMRHIADGVVEAGKIAVADFNSASFSSFNLKTSNKFLNTSDQMIIVKSFPNSIEAMNYYDAFRVNKGKIKNYSDQNFFLLTPDNLKSLYLEKKIDEYLKFFKAFYL